jgi:hypothetical protein
LNPCVDFRSALNANNFPSGIGLIEAVMHLT